MKTFKISLMLLIPLLAMTEGGAMYQRQVIIPLWIDDMSLMKEFHHVDFYFLRFTPPVVAIWLIMVMAGSNYNGKLKMLLRINHFIYLTIIVSTGLYFIPFLDKYVSNSEAVINRHGLEQLKTWAAFSLIRQVSGFIVIAIYVYILSEINLEINKSTK